MKKTAFLFVFFLIFSYVSKAQNIRTPESAQIFNGKIYISNIGNLPPSKKDGDGFIALFDKKGNFLKVLTKKLNAPKGMVILKNRLYVTDIDTIAVINIENGKTVKKIKINGAKFLNDIATDGKNLFISDTLLNTIYKIPLNTSKPEIFINSDTLDGPNGLFYENGYLLCVTWNHGKILKVFPNKMETVGKVNGNLDGIVKVKDFYLFSDFKNGIIYKLKNGKISKFKKGFTTPADIGYGDGLLIIPEFYKNDFKTIEIK